MGEGIAHADEFPELCLKLLDLIVGAAVVVENSIHKLFSSAPTFSQRSFIGAVTDFGPPSKRKRLCTHHLRHHTLLCDVQLFESFYS